MLAARRALLAAALLAPGVAAETVSFEQGPIVLSGPQFPMRGPTANGRAEFGRPGWIRGMKVSVRGAKDGARLPKRLLCHANLFRPSADDPVTSIEGLRLSADSGQSDIEFPEGFGVYVDTMGDQRIGSMLQDPKAKNGGDYSVDFQIDFAPDDGRHPLVSLKDLIFFTHEPGPWKPVPGMHDHKGRAVRGIMWDLAPGRHVYEERIAPPFTAKVHYLWFHLHQYTTEVSLLDPRDGRVLFRAPVVNGPDGWAVEKPFFSSRDPLVLEKGREYVYRTAYDNTSAEAVPTMSAVRIYFEASDIPVVASR